MQIAWTKGPIAAYAPGSNADLIRRFTSSLEFPEIAHALDADAFDDTPVSEAENDAGRVRPQRVLDGIANSVDRKAVGASWVVGPAQSPHQ